MDQDFAPIVIVEGWTAKLAAHFEHREHALHQDLQVCRESRVLGLRFKDIGHKTIQGSQIELEEVWRQVREHMDLGGQAAFES